MKKKVIAALVAMFVAGIIGFSFSQFGSVNAEPNLSPADIREKITAQYPGTIKELELDKKGNSPIYEVELEIDGKEYEIEIDGNTGEVIRLDKNLAQQQSDDDKKLVVKEKENQEANNNSENTKSKQQAANNKNEKQQEKKTEQSLKQKKDDDDKEDGKKNIQKSKNAIIGENKAIDIALKQFSGTVKELEVDEDDGRLIYEIEIKNGKKEADIEIDAYTGEVLVIEIDTDDDDDD